MTTTFESAVRAEPGCECMVSVERRESVLSQKTLAIKRIVAAAAVAHDTDCGGVMLRDALWLLYRVPKSRPLAVVVDGQPRGELEDVRLRAGQHVIFAPMPGDPVNGLLLGITIIASLASSAIMTRGRGIRGSDRPRQQQYGFGTLTEAAFAGDRKPVVLGELERWGGKGFSPLVFEATDGSGNQRLLYVAYMSQGPIESIGNFTAAVDAAPHTDMEGIFIDGQDARNYVGAKCYVRLGLPGQTPIPGFGDEERLLRNVGSGGFSLRNTSGSDRTGSSASGEAFTFTTSGPVDAVIIRVAFDDGLYSVRDGSQTYSARVQWRARTRATGGGSWSAWQVFTVEQLRQSQLFSSPRVQVHSSVAVEIQVERVTRESTDNTVQDAMRWDSVYEVKEDVNAYEGDAFLAVELTAGENRQNEPRISARIKGYAKCKVWDRVSTPGAMVFVDSYTNNAAELALTAATDVKWGAGATWRVQDFPQDSLAAAITEGDATENVTLQDGSTITERRWQCDIALQRADPLDKVMRTLLATMEAVPVLAGNQWRFVLDKPQTMPVETFTDGSIYAVDAVPQIEVERIATIAPDDDPTGSVRANQVVVQFENRETPGTPDTAVYPRLGTKWLGETSTEIPRQRQISMPGVTRARQAMRHAVRELRRQRFVQRNVKFTTTVAVPSVLPGERFDLATSFVVYGIASGRVLAGSTSAGVAIDTTVQLLAGHVYTLRVQHLDNSVETRTITLAPGVYARGVLITLDDDLATVPAEGAEYVIERDAGSVGQIAAKPYICRSVRAVENEGDDLLWEISGEEYVADVFAPPDQEVTIPNYSGLVTADTPPGALRGLRAFERRNSQTGELKAVLAWTQWDVDVPNTASFLVFWRLVGDRAWIPATGITPGSSPQSVVVDLADPDVGYEFIVIAVSSKGARLNPYDPRHPIATLALGLGEEAPDVPATVTATNVSGNVYDLTWDAVDGASGYAVISGHIDAGGIFDDAADGFVLARTTLPELRGLKLPISVGAVTFSVRSVGRNGRMSQGCATVIVTNTNAPAGKTVKHTFTADIPGSGTRTNVAAVSGAQVPSDVTLEAVWESGEIDTGSSSAMEVVARLITAERVQVDSDFTTIPFLQPSLELASFGIVSTGPDVIGMLWPPYTDDGHQWRVEVAFKSGSTYGAWQALTPYASLTATGQFYKVRVLWKRGRYPYRPGVMSLGVVATA